MSKHHCQRDDFTFALQYSTENFARILLGKMRTITVRGFTVLEVLVAIFIFATVFSLMLYTIRGADRIGGRGAAGRYAAKLALNEAERVRTIAVSTNIPNDTAYTRSVRGVEFTVKRSVTILRAISAEIEIEVIPTSQNFPPHTFKIYQGLQQ